MNKQIIENLQMFKQTQLIRHHSLLRQFAEEEESLMEDLSKIDFSLVDFVESCYRSSTTTT